MPRLLSAKSVTLYVDGNHVGQSDGSRKSPYTSIEEATKRICQLRADGCHEAIDIQIAPGIYELDTPITLNTPNNETTDGVITFRSNGNGRVILSGGRSISNWEQIAPNHWIAQLPDVKAGNWYFRQLFAGERRLTRARTPNKGFLMTRGPLSRYAGNLGKYTWGGKPTKETVGDYWLVRCGFGYSDTDIRYWNDWKNAEILTFHSWESSWQAIQSIDTLHKDVYFTSPCRYPVGTFGNNMRYRIENIREALDQPGEWFLDRTTGGLHLLTAPGEDPNTMQIHAPRLTTLVELTGQPGQPVANIAFEHIDFQYTDYRMGLYDTAPNWPREIQQGYPWFPSDIRPGFTGSQAAPTVGSSITLTYANNIRFEQCGIRHLGAIAVEIGRGSRQVKLNGCEINDIGGGGIYIGMDVRLVEEAGIPHSDAPAENTISNCLIHGIGHIHPASVGIWIAQTYDNRITNNELSYISYSGISLGWTWGFEPNYTKNNYIARNYIHHTAQILGDAAGMYSLGDCSGSIYEANHIDSIYKGEGVYGVVDAMGFDECSSNITIRNNVVGDISGKVASFGRQSSAELQQWENNNFDMDIQRPKLDSRSEMDQPTFTAHVRFTPGSTFINLSGWHEQRWLMRKNGNANHDGFFGMLIQGKQAVAYLNVGGGSNHVHQIATNPASVVDDSENTATLSYDGQTMRFYYNGQLIEEKYIGQPRTPGKGKLEIAPIDANSLRNGIDELRIIPRAVTPDEAETATDAYEWKAPVHETTLDIQKVIREAGPDPRYAKTFISR